MPTHVTDQRDATLGSAAKEVAEHASALVRPEIELAKLEVGRKFQSLGIGVGLGVGAALFALYAVGFLFATVAAGLATVVDVWLALLIVTLFLIVATAILATLTGTLAAIGLMRLAPAYTRTILAGLSLPVLLPPLVIAIAIVVLFVRGIGVGLGVPVVILGHILVSQPFVILIVMARLARFDQSAVESLFEHKVVA